MRSYAKRKGHNLPVITAVWTMTTCYAHMLDAAWCDDKLYIFNDVVTRFWADRIFNIFPHINSSATDDIWKHCGKGETAHYEKFLLFPQRFQFCSLAKHLFIYIFRIFDQTFSESFAAFLKYLGEALNNQSKDWLAVHILSTC